jgi:chromosome segregation ATPase
MQERLESREARVAELEARVAALEGERSAGDAALASALRRVRDLQEESSALRTRAHDHHAHALQLQAGLADTQVCHLPTSDPHIHSHSTTNIFI